MDVPMHARTIPEPTLRSDPDEALWDRALAWQAEAEALLEAGELDAATRLLGEAVAALDVAVGAEHPDAAYARVGFARGLELGGALEQAAELLAAALDVLERWVEEEQVWPLLLDAREHAAASARARGDFETGRELLRRAAELASARAGVDSIERAWVDNARGVHEKLAGRLDAAAVHYSRCVEVHEAHGLEIPAELHHNLAGLACERGQHELAEEHARAALFARRGQGSSLALGADWAGLGDALEGLGRLDEAVAAYERALALYVQVGHRHHPEYAYALHNLADAEARRGRSEVAATYYRRALARKRALFGPVHHELAASHHNLAVLLVDCGDVAEAAAEARRALAAAASTPSDHPIRRACEALAASFELA